MSTLEIPFSEEEAAHRLVMHVKSLRKIRRLKGIRYIERGRFAVYTQAFLDEYNKAHEVQTVNESARRDRIAATLGHLKAGFADWPPRPGWVYFVTDGDIIKIGFTTRSVTSRLKAFQTGNPKPLTLLCLVAADRTLEQSLHRQFREYHCVGEWFNSCDEILAWARWLPELQRVAPP